MLLFGSGCSQQMMCKASAGKKKLEEKLGAVGLVRNTTQHPTTMQHREAN